MSAEYDLCMYIHICTNKVNYEFLFNKLCSLILIFVVRT